MSLLLQKGKISVENFELRKNKAIDIIKNKEFIATNRIKHKFSEEQLRNDFVFEDIDRIYYKFDNVFFNGDFVFFPEDKIIWV